MSEKSTRVSKLRSEPLKPVGAQSAHAWGEVWRRRTLLNLLVRREIKVRYKDSMFGVLWSLGRPLVQLMIYYFAIGKILGAERGITSFAIFIFVGFSLWTLFNDAVNAATTSIINNSGLVRKIYLPRELFPLSVMGSALVNFLVYLAVLVVATLLIGQPPVLSATWQGLVGLGIALVYAMALGLMLSVLNVYLRDIEHFTELALSIFFWLTPVVYSFQRVHEALSGSWLEQLYLLNPMAIAVMGMQKALWAGGSQEHWPPDLDARLLITFGAGLVFLWIAQLVFSRLQANVAQEL